MQEDDATTIRHSEGEPPSTRSLTDVLVGAAAAVEVAKVIPPVAGKIKDVLWPAPNPESPIIQAPPSYSPKTTDE